MSTTQGEIDTLEFGVIKEVLTDKTFEKYKQTWVEFVGLSGIGVSREPEEKDFLKFFTGKRSNGLKGSYLKSLYSHVNKFYNLLYKRNLSVRFVKN